ncbi:sigma 54-interacting transcriptional regulator [Hirschia baltica]|uniref:DNA-binding transcriptional regulator NtrC n=1 Tax=Hirschia baltica (strain ATCC 49814 / DSM 5838 / IFAM 1418) TaxID=582402 RepID=C6XJQ5_HIRBI|nr:sigma 54-interacting transcriptional regulator [Hirschia baltica]ACT59350.1 two component, sigma54 specific, transcriptional regulator, Fis family [Hirschia baltica ATCC 49814]
MSGPTVLVADDDSSVRLVVSQTLAQEGYHVRSTNTASTLWKWIEAGEGDLLITDVYMPDESIFDIMPKIRQERPELPIIVISGQSTVLTATMASDHGVYDYMPKPFDIDVLADSVKRALQKRSLKGIEPASRKAEKDEALPLIGRSTPMQNVYRVIARVMNTDLTVLIEGESGTGKDLCASAIHDLGKRKSGPFVAVSLAALQKEQVEADLFGVNIDGEASSPGRVGEANGGTLYLDEVGDMPLEAQTRLLRFLQDGQYSSHGGGPVRQSDARIIASTKHDLRNLVEQGLFREDLYYRLNVVSLSLPPLRERKEDILELAAAFLVRAKREGLPEKQLDKSAYDLLSAYDWPGNVRELENLIRRLAALSPEPVISAREIEREMRSGTKPETKTDAFEAEVEALLSRHFMARLSIANESEGTIYQNVIEQVERPLLKLALAATNGNKVRAASLLGLNRNTLRSKINSLEISDEE